MADKNDGGTTAFITLSNHVLNPAHIVNVDLDATNPHKCITVKTINGDCINIWGEDLKTFLKAFEAHTGVPMKAKFADDKKA